MRLPLLPVLLLALAAVPLTAAAAGRSVVAVSESGLMHLDESGALLAWRPEVFQWWQRWHVATNPRNGTVCWVSEPEDQKAPGVVRCATVANLNQTWDLPQPRDFSVSKPDAIAFDWLEGNWYLTASRVNYVCSYMFDRCAQLGKSGGNVRYFAAYDIPNRLLFRIATVETGPYKLEVLNLDGSGLRELPTSLNYPSGLAVDPVQRHVYVMDIKAADNPAVGLYKLDYNGEGKQLLLPLDREAYGISWQRSLDVLDGRGVAMHNDQRTISAFSAADGERTNLVDGAVKGETVPALAKVEKLLAVKIFSPETQPDVENRCGTAACSDLCIPTLANGTAEFSCLCPEGERLVDLACHKDYPLYALVAGGDKLQVVDMQTEEATTILANLSDVSAVDFFWEDGELVLFWVEAGSLFRGHWQPGAAVVADVRLLLEASKTRRVVEVAVNWVHRHLLWMERDPTKSRYSKQLTIVLSPLDASYRKTIVDDYSNDKRAIFVYDAGETLAYVQTDFGSLVFSTRNMTGSTAWSLIGMYGKKFLTSLPTQVAVDASLSGEPWQQRLFWVSAADEAVDYLSKRGMMQDIARSRLLTHPSLSHAGGLAVLGPRLFWTDGVTGQLWTADSVTGDSVRALPVETDGGALRLLHPWAQPPPHPSRDVCDADGSGCSHFCLTGEEGWERVPRCACPDNMTLGDDGKTCQN